MYTTFGSGFTAVGLPPRVRGPPQRSMRDRPTAPDARRSYEFIKVLGPTVSPTARLTCCQFSPMRLLRTFPPLEALPVIGIAVTLVRDLPPELYDELVKHPYDIQSQ